ncbi:MAG TPA: VOC family protein [Azospirillum sp.]|nr:VOC family protein [Azospirillum sp.]
MHDPNFVILYVNDAPASAAFYAGLLGAQPVESSPGFAMFVLPSGFRLGLWARHTVQPAATGAVGGGELVFTVADADMVGATHADWSRRGLRIAQEPTAMEFGHTFTALDPDGHRLRVYAPGEP